MENPVEPPPVPDQPPQRHGCLTAWLIFMIVTNAFTVVAVPFSMNSAKQTGLNPTPMAVGVLVVAALANIAFAVALLRWKKWGFYGFAATSVVALVTNLSMGAGIGQSLLGMTGIVLLYGVLNIGEKNNKGWPQLR